VRCQLEGAGVCAPPVLGAAPCGGIPFGPLRMNPDAALQKTRSASNSSSARQRARRA
jgi:hypothetical protein